jgi:hypothetical protein
MSSWQPFEVCYIPQKSWMPLAGFRFTFLAKMIMLILNAFALLLSFAAHSYQITVLTGGLADFGEEANEKV